VLLLVGFFVATRSANRSFMLGTNRALRGKVRKAAGLEDHSALLSASSPSATVGRSKVRPLHNLIGASHRVAVKPGSSLGFPLSSAFRGWAR